MLMFEVKEKSAGKRSAICLVFQSTIIEQSTIPSFNALIDFMSVGGIPISLYPPLPFILFLLFLFPLIEVEESSLILIES